MGQALYIDQNQEQNSPQSPKSQRPPPQPPQFSPSNSLEKHEQHVARSTRRLLLEEALEGGQDGLGVLRHHRCDHALQRPVALSGLLLGLGVRGGICGAGLRVGVRSLAFTCGRTIRASMQDGVRYWYQMVGKTVCKFRMIKSQQHAEHQQQLHQHY
jgi:hypothetical protein